MVKKIFLQIADEYIQCQHISPHNDVKRLRFKIDKGFVCRRKGE